MVSRPKEVVLVGAGHAHVIALRDFGCRAVPGGRLTLVSRDFFTPYSGMLPGLVAGHYRYDDAHIDVRPLAHFAGARLLRDEATGLDLAGRRLLCKEQGPVPFDILSFDIGSAPNTAGVPGAGEHAVAIKPIDRLLAAFDKLLSRTRERRGRTHVAMVGAGAGGVELLLSVEARLRFEVARAGFDPAGLSFTLISGTADILPAFPATFRERFRTILTARGFGIVTNAKVVRVGSGRLYLEQGEPIDADEILWATHAAPVQWLSETGLPVDASGFLRVDDYLRVVGHDAIFAAGDTMAFEPRNLPKSGVYAVRAGPVLAENIRRATAGQRLKKFRPQERALYLISVGKKYAVGTRNGITVSGYWVWRWKDWLDRRFMGRFKRLPGKSSTGGASS
ncbi:MAG: FAD-dependent oxidoreductase [Pseudorhodoplanes sp.]|uniref:FAD-dependent oxidoreductase n=1 Tax=Pseudorhodoplanes sp. TaxID=1934341 RepID=UPI003D0FECA9